MTASYGSGYYAASAPKQRPPVFLIVFAVVLAGTAAAIYLRESREAETPPAAAEPIVETLEEAASVSDDREELLRENALEAGRPASGRDPRWRQRRRWAQA